MKNIIKLGVFVLGIALFLVAVPALAAGPAPTLSVHKNKTTVNVGEKVTVSALSGVFVEDDLLAFVAPDKIEFYVDGVKSDIVVCEKQFNCAIKLFWLSGSKGLNKWHQVTAKSTYNGKTTSQSTWIFATNKQQPVAQSEAPKFEKIITSGHQPKVGDTFSAEIYPKDYSELQKITVLLDGVKQKDCILSATAQTCAMSVGPLTANQVGEHTYTFNLVGKNGKTSAPWGKFTVNALPTPAQESIDWDKVITSPVTVLVGETFTATAYAKPNKTVYQMEGYVDDVLSKTCQNASVCTLAFEGKQSNLGTHTYKFIFKAQNGLSLNVTGNFTVVEGKDLVAPNVSVSSDKDTLKTGESAALSATASDNKAVTNLQILVAGAVVKECANATTCSYTIGPVSENPGTLKYSYSARAYDAAGNNMWTGNKYINIEITQPVVEPMVSIITSKTNLSPNETVDFTANVNPGSKTLTKLQILVNLKLAKECYTNSCVFTGGPYTGSNVNYAATAFFSDGTYKTTGYNIISVITTPTVSIYPNKLQPKDNELITFTAAATTGGKTLEKLQIVVNDKIVKECTTTMCAYTGGPYTQYSRQNITYAATACFVGENLCITTWNKNLWIYSSVPNAT